MRDERVVTVLQKDRYGGKPGGYMNSVELVQETSASHRNSASPLSVHLWDPTLGPDSFPAHFPVDCANSDHLQRERNLKY
jgi:hypothetical protein